MDNRPNTNKLLVFNLQKYSLHDGSGIRTVVFLKGCPLRCRWCCNPESQSVSKELMYRKSKCLGKEKCGLCKECAPEGCIRFEEDGKAKIDFQIANRELEWTKVCPTNALAIEGQWMTIDEILDIVERDSVFYRSGRGGLTVSGGEPLMQENTVVLLEEAKKRHIHTCIETCGFVPQERMLRAAKYLDEMFMDIKSLSDEVHEQFTGVKNKQIRENLKAVCDACTDKKITVRTPVIPGFNDAKEELEKIETYLKQFANVTWEKLPYHTYGVQKYEMLGREYSL